MAVGVQVTYQGRESGATLDGIAVDNLNVRRSPDDTVNSEFGYNVSSATTKGSETYVA
jgi:hypothetical protein